MIILNINKHYIHKFLKYDYMNIILTIFLIIYLIHDFVYLKYFIFVFNDFVVIQIHLLFK